MRRWLQDSWLARDTVTAVYERFHFTPSSSRRHSHPETEHLCRRWEQVEDGSVSVGKEHRNKLCPYPIMDEKLPVIPFVLCKVLLCCCHHTGSGHQHPNLCVTFSIMHSSRVTLILPSGRMAHRPQNLFAQGGCDRLEHLICASRQPRK
ncbi:uncharacterized protein LJ206_001667 [Theristicus caerulescens]